jgi:hypothetical protein
MEQAPPFQAAFALAGGKLPSPLVPESWIPNLWLLGVRTGNYRQAIGGLAGRQAD